MIRPISPRPSISSPDAPRELEAIVRRLWTTEPRCSLQERAPLLTELAAVGLTVERIILRDEAQRDRSEIDDDLRAADLAACDRRVHDLVVRWSGDLATHSRLLAAA